jgi:hypothetical protein
MATDSSAAIRVFSPGIILALLAILFGFGLGAAFGTVEESIKAHLNGSAEQVLDSVYHGDVSKKEAVVSKSWIYMKRAHLHGGAIGAVALASICLLVLLGHTGALERLSAFALGAGSLVYSLFWLLAALKAPGMGSTHAAKESLGFIAIPGAALALLGVLGTLAAVVRHRVASTAFSDES